MANFYDWSSTAADNDDAGTPINWAENQAPSTVNNSAREQMKQTADFRDFLGGAKITATADTMTLTSGMTITAYAQGMLFAAEIGATNTTACTLNIDSVGAKAVVKKYNVPLIAGDIVAGQIALFAYEASADNFQLLSNTATLAFDGTTGTFSGIVSVDDTTDTTSGTTGSIHTDGGVGIAKALWVATTSRFVGVTTHGGDVLSDTDGTDSIGSTGVRWLKGWFDSLGVTGDVAAATGTFSGEVTGTGFTGTLDGTLGGGTPAAATVTTVVASGVVSVDDVTDSTSATTGSIHSDGGLGIAKALYIGTTAEIVGVTTHGGDVLSDTDGTDSIGSTGTRWLKGWFDSLTATGDVGAATGTFTGEVTATGFTGTLDGTLGGGTPAVATVTTLNATTVASTDVNSTNVDGIIGGDTARDGSFSTLSASSNVTASTAPSAGGHLTNKTYVDGLLTGVAGRTTVRVASTADVDLSSALTNGDTIDSITLATGDVVLVKNQTATEENGIYDVPASGAASRNEYFDTWVEYPGSFVTIQEGATQEDTFYLCTTDVGSGVLGTTGITYTIVSPQNVGTVTSVATGGIATGGPITGSGTVTVTKATGAEVITGTNDAKAVTPKAVTDSGIYIANGTDVAIADGGTGSSTALAGFDNLKQAASVTYSGSIEVATIAETNTGTDATRAVSPDGLNDWTGGAGAITKLGTIATGVWNGTAINATYLDGQSGTNTGDEAAASLTVAGVIEIATPTEVNTGTDDTRAVSPVGLTAWTGDTALATVGTIATGTWQGTAVAQAYIADNSISLAKMAHGTDGNLITYDAAGAPASVATGDAGDVLTSGGAGVAPTMAAPAGGGFTTATVQLTTSGTDKLFSSIPAGTTMIVVQFETVSQSSTGALEVTIGDAGGLETTGYLTNAVEETTDGLYTDSFRVKTDNAARTPTGQMILTLQDAATFKWACSYITHSASVDATLFWGSGIKALSAELTQLNVGVTTGAFDLGSVNIMYQ